MLENWKLRKREQNTTKKTLRKLTKRSHGSLSRDGIPSLSTRFSLWPSSILRSIKFQLSASHPRISPVKAHYSSICEECVFFSLSLFSHLRSAALPATRRSCRRLSTTSLSLLRSFWAQFLSPCLRTSHSPRSACTFHLLVSRIDDQM